MDKIGNADPPNMAGTACGIGYCDGQCARDLKWVNAKGNNENWCCAEIDLWEAVKFAIAFAPLHVCTGENECGSQEGDSFVGPTDRDGCDINAYRMGELNLNFHGPGSQFAINTEKPFKVVTKFHALRGELEEIEQIFVQDGREIQELAKTQSPMTSLLHRRFLLCRVHELAGFIRPCDPADGLAETLHVKLTQTPRSA